MVWRASAILLILSLATLSVVSHLAPRTQQSKNDFSGQRALEILHELLDDVGAHPVGTQAHDVVLERIVRKFESLHLPVVVERGTSCSEENVCAHLANVVARLPGTTELPSVALSAHYDSVAAAPGFADDGAGVATLIAIAEQLSKEAPRARQVMFVFTDGEEDGLLGARLFASSSPFAKQIGTFVNLEARGTSGPSLLFETSRGNLALLDDIRAQPAPLVTTSLATAVYERLTNGSDLSVWKGLGAGGFNFAFIEKASLYHTGKDDGANLDPRSVQHQGSQALALVRRLSDATAPPTSASGDAVFFDVFGRFLVAWPVSWAVPLAVVSLILLLVGAARSFSRFADVRRVTMVALAFFSAIALAVALGFGVQAIATRDPAGDWPASRWLFLAGSSLAALVVVRASLSICPRSATSSHRFFAAWLLNAGLGLLIAFSVPGAHYLFTAPALVAGLVGVGIGRTGRRARKALATIPVLVVTTIFPVTIVSFLYAALGSRALPVTSLLVALAGIGASPLFLRATWAALAASCVAPLALVAVASATPSYSTETPRIGNAVVAMDRATRVAEADLEGWDAPPEVRREFSERVHSFRWGPGVPFRRLAYEEREGPSWTMSTRLVTPRGVEIRGTIRPAHAARAITVLVERSPNLLEWRAGDRPMRLQTAEESGEWLSSSFLAPAMEGESLFLLLRDASPIKVVLVEEIVGFPENFGLLPWATPAYSGNRTLVGESVTLQ